MQFKLKLKSTSPLILKIYSNFIQKLLIRSRNSSTNVSLPTKCTRITLLKSPHVYKKAREQFELKIYQKFFFVSFANAELIRFFLVNKPKSLRLEIKKI
jgi:ribosomal protein S10